MSGTPGYWCKKLSEWQEQAEKEGLLDIKFFPYLHPQDPEVDIEDAARAAYELITGEGEDITDKTL